MNNLLDGLSTLIPNFSISFKVISIKGSLTGIPFSSTSDSSNVIYSDA